MREVAYLSPTSIGIFYEDMDKFYLMYLATERVPRTPQTKPMSIGSSFDAYVKSYLHSALFGAGHDVKYSFEALFEAQVEAHNRDWAREHGKHVFDTYKRLGALVDLMLQLGKAIGKPRFEFEVRGVVDGRVEGIESTMHGVTLLGRPDCFFVNEEGAHVILDWKVNGYCSDHTTSPMKGYARLREDGKFPMPHKDAVLTKVDGMWINSGAHLENLHEDCAKQLSIYAWLCGEDIGSNFINVVHQIVCKPGVPVQLRVAEHALRTSRNYQVELFKKILG